MLSVNESAGRAPAMIDVSSATGMNMVMTDAGPSGPDLSIVIVNWNTRELLARCIDAIRKQGAQIDYDVWVVDNASTDGSVAFLRAEFPWVHLLEAETNLGFARANNWAMATCRGRAVLLLNSDAFLLPGALEEMLAVIGAASSAGAVGAQLLNPDGSFQAGASPFPTLWSELLVLTTLGRRFYGQHYPSAGPDERDTARPVDYVEGACLLVRREALETVGGLDDGYFMYAEEVDWCYRMRQAGWEVWYAPAAQVVHLGGASSANRRPQREADLYRSRVRFFRQHRGNTQAVALKFMIIALSLPKVAWHKSLRSLSGGRRGRPVVGLRMLWEAMRGV